MPIYLDESTAIGLISQEEAVSAVENALAAYGRGEALNSPRMWLPQPNGALNIVAGAIPYSNVTGFKVFANFGQGREWRLFLFDTLTGRLMGILAANGLSDLRTVASSLVSIKCMAKPDARVFGIIGAGHQARIHARALVQGGWCDHLLIYSRTLETANALRMWLEPTLEPTNVSLTIANSAKEVSTRSDVIITATKATTPVLRGSWLSPGTHVVAMGTHARDRSEIDKETLERATHIAVDCLRTAREQYGELIDAVDSGSMDWSEVRPISDYIVQTANPLLRQTGDLSVYKPGGIGLLDVAVGHIVLSRAKELEKGQKLLI